MKAVHLKVVNDLMRVRKQCENALNDAKNFVDMCEKDEERDADHTEHTKVFYGYYRGCLSEYDDGSGINVNISGCYIAKGVALATIDLLVEQVQTINSDLKELGVEL